MRALTYEELGAEVDSFSVQLMRVGIKQGGHRGVYDESDG